MELENERTSDRNAHDYGLDNLSCIAFFVVNSLFITKASAWLIPTTMSPNILPTSLPLKLYHNWTTIIYTGNALVCLDGKKPKDFLRKGMLSPQYFLLYLGVNALLSFTITALLLCYLIGEPFCRPMLGSPPLFCISISSHQWNVSFQKNKKK